MKAGISLKLFLGLSLLSLSGAAPIAESDSAPDLCGFGREAVALYEEGLLNMDAGRHVAAIESFGAALADAPGFAVAHRELGFAMLEVLGKYHDAMDAFDRALELAPDSARAFWGRGRVKVLLGNRKEAMGDFDRALEIAPSLVDAWISRAKANAWLGRDRDANNDLNEALVLFPMNAEALHARGNTYMSLDRFDEAMADFDKALEIDPKFADAYMDRALATLPDGGCEGAVRDNCGKALADLDAAARFAPSNPEIFFLRFGIKMEMEDAAGALRDEEKALSLYGKAGNWLMVDVMRQGMGMDRELRDEDADDPQLREAWEILQAGEHGKVLAKLDGILEADPRHVDAVLLRGAAAMAMDDYKSAERSYGRALRIDPLNPYAYHARGITRERLGKHEAAIKDYTESLRLEPGNAEVYRHRGFLKRRMGDFVGAVGDLTQTLEAGGFHSCLLYSIRAAARIELEDYGGAISDIDRCLALDRRYSSALYFKRGIANLEMSSYRQASDDFSKAYDLDRRGDAGYLLLYRGLARARLGDAGDAMRDFGSVTADGLKQMLDSDVDAYRRWAEDGLRQAVELRVQMPRVNEI